MPDLEKLLETDIGGFSLGNLLASVVIFLVSLIIIKLLMKAIKKALDRSKLERAIRSFILSCARVLLWVLVALIIADKSDVHKSRVKNVIEDTYNVEDIHDRVNLAAESSFITVDGENKRIVLEVTIDTAVCDVVDYFKIYLNRMNMCTAAAKLLGYEFGLEINKVRFQ